MVHRQAGQHHVSAVLASAAGDYVLHVLEHDLRVGGRLVGGYALRRPGRTGGVDDHLRLGLGVSRRRRGGEEVGIELEAGRGGRVDADSHDVHARPRRRESGGVRVV